MTTETVQYLVPVNVEIDLDERTVTRVVVVDEAARLDGGEEPGSTAVQIAEATEWPRWEFGY